MSFPPKLAAEEEKCGDEEQPFASQGGMATPQLLITAKLQLD